MFMGKHFQLNQQLAAGAVLSFSLSLSLSHSVVCCVCLLINTSSFHSKWRPEKYWQPAYCIWSQLGRGEAQCNKICLSTLQLEVPNDDEGYYVVISWKSPLGEESGGPHWFFFSTVNTRNSPKTASLEGGRGWGTLMRMLNTQHIHHYDSWYDHRSVTLGSV